MCVETHDILIATKEKNGQFLTILPVSFVSATPPFFLNGLQLINLHHPHPPAFVRNSWHRHKPRRRETLPTGYMSKLSGFQSQISGGKVRFHVLPMKWGEPCQCWREGGYYRYCCSLFSNSLCATGKLHGLPDTLSPWGGAASTTQGHFQGR